MNSELKANPFLCSGRSKAKRVPWVMLFGIAVLLALPGCTHQLKNHNKLTTNKAFPQRLSVLYTGHRYGEIEPCGCQAVPLGGIEREYNVLQFWGSFEDRDLIYLGGGTTFVPDPSTFDVKLLDHYRVKAKHVLEGLASLGVQVLSPSAEDLVLGVETLQKLASETSMALVNANLVHSGTEDTVFSSHVEWEYPEGSIVVIGVSDGTASKKYPSLPNISVLDPIVAVERVLGGLEKKQNRFIILISSLSDERRTKLLSAVPQINYVVGGTPAQATPDVMMLSGNTLYSNPPDRARWISRVDLNLKLPFQGFYSEAEAETFGIYRAKWQKQLNTIQSRLAGKLSTRKRAELNAKKATYQKYLDRALSIPIDASEDASTFDGTVVRLSSSFDGQNKMTEIVNRYKNVVRTIAVDSAAGTQNTDSK